MPGAERAVVPLYSDSLILLQGSDSGGGCAGSDYDDMMKAVPMKVYDDDMRMTVILRITVC